MESIKQSFRSQQLRRELEELEADIIGGQAVDAPGRLADIYRELRSALLPLPPLEFNPYGELARYAFGPEEREIFENVRRCFTPGLINSAGADVVLTAVRDALAKWPAA